MLWKKKKRRPGDPPEMGSLEHRIQVCKAYTQLWQNLFQFFAESLEDKQITPEEEKEFARNVYLLAYDHFKFTKLMADDFHQSKGILRILDKCSSLSHLRSMPEAAFAAMQVDWHEIFIGMNKTLGLLLTQLPPEEPAKEQRTKSAPLTKGKTQAKTNRPATQPGQPGA